MVEASHASETTIRIPRWAIAPALLRAMSILIGISAAGACLVLLGRLDPPPPIVRSYLAAGDGQATLLLDLPRFHEDPSVRVVLSRAPHEIDARHGLLRLAGGIERVLPPEESLVLVDAEGSLRTVEGGLPVSVLLELRRDPPGQSESLGQWFQRPVLRGPLGKLGSLLDGFWGVGAPEPLPPDGR